VARSRPRRRHGRDQDAVIRLGSTRPQDERAIGRWATSAARSIGMANPMPMLPDPRVAMEVLTPTTRPAVSTSGPPELPGLIAASVWTATCRAAVSEPGLPVGRAHDPRGDRAAQAQRRPDGQHRFVDPQVGGGAQRRRSREPCSRCAENGHVGRRVGADDLGRDPATVRQHELDLPTGRDDVRVRDHVAAVVDDEAGAGGLAASSAARSSARRRSGRTGGRPRAARPASARSRSASDHARTRHPIHQASARLLR
jgi:hypothetical protein